MIIQLLSNTPSKVAAYCEQGLSVILLQNGVYAALSLIADYPKCTFYAVKNDYFASGLPKLENLILVSDMQWVNLCAQQHPVITIQQ